MQLIQQSIRIYLRSYLQPYEQLKKCEQDILQMTEKEFNGQLGTIEGQEPFVNTLWSSHRTKSYSSWIYRIDKHLKDLNDLNESFKKVNNNLFSSERVIQKSQRANSTSERATRNFRKANSTSGGALRFRHLR